MDVLQNICKNVETMFANDGVNVIRGFKNGIVKYIFIREGSHATCEKCGQFVAFYSHKPTKILNFIYLGFAQCPNHPEDYFDIIKYPHKFDEI